MFARLLVLVMLVLALPALAGPWRASEDNIHGWQLMTPAERLEHQRRLRGFDSYDDCRSYQAAIHARMEARARDAGVVLRPRGQSACEQLRAQGRAR